MCVKLAVKFSSQLLVFFTNVPKFSAELHKRSFFQSVEVGRQCILRFYDTCLNLIKSCYLINCQVAFVSEIL